MIAYAEQLGTWLDTYNWEYWATFTLSPRRLAGSRWAQRLQQLGYAPSSRDLEEARSHSPSVPQVRRALSAWSRTTKPERVFWGTEPGKINGRIHAHALLDFKGKWPNPTALWEEAFRTMGRSQIDRFEPEKGASHYVSKYVTKRLSDFDLWTYGDYI